MHTPSLSRRVAASATVALLVLAGACTGSDPKPATTATIRTGGTTTGSARGEASGTVLPERAPRFTEVTDLEEQEVFATTGPLQVSLLGRRTSFAFVARDDGGLLVGSSTSSSYPDPVQPTDGLYLVRDGARTPVRSAELGIEDGVPTASLTFTDGATATLTVLPVTNQTVQFVLKPDDPAGVTEWGISLAKAPDEAIYGLTERIVDDMNASEWTPAEVGSLDRSGEVVTMYTRATISGYAPFYQSSKGYGLLVDGTMPGVYDIGKTDPNVIDVRFELSPTAKEGSFHLFHGPGHAQILDEYTRLTGRPPRPPDPVFTTWRGRDEYRSGPTAEWHGITINADVARDLQAYDDHHIPPGVFHFDRPWAVGQEGYGDFRFDPVRFPNAEQMLAEMQKAGWHMEVWTSPWAIGPLGEEAKVKGFLAPNSPRALDLTHPDARAWIKGKLVAFLRGPEGRYIDGFFMDRGEEGDVTSQATDVYHDGRTGREVHNDYVVLFDRLWREAMDEARPDGSGWLIARGAYTGSQAFVMRWGGDTHSREGILIPEQPETTPVTDKGLRSVLISIQRAAFMGTAYWGSDIAGYSDWSGGDREFGRELYQRWVEVGAASPLMRFHGKGPAPWDAGPGGTLDAELLGTYRRYVELHAQLAPYLGRLADENHRTGLTLVRPLVFTWPTEAAARNRWDEWTLGPDVLVAPVWRVGDRERSVWFPPGRWVDWWDGTVTQGPVERTVAAPVDRLPLYVREGGAVRPPS